ncbi:MAG: hypothetical protein AAF298_29580 [Cyanobacteria bacterium P01_A01_bin.40]
MVFNSDDRDNIATWDLESFERAKITYNIYWIQIEPFEDEIYKITSIFLTL